MVLCASSVGVCAVAFGFTDDWYVLIFAAIRGLAVVPFSLSWTGLIGGLGLEYGARIAAGSVITLSVTGAILLFAMLSPVLLTALYCALPVGCYLCLSKSRKLLHWEPPPLLPRTRVRPMPLPLLASVLAYGIPVGFVLALTTSAPYTGDLRFVPVLATGGTALVLAALFQKAPRSTDLGLISRTVLLVVSLGLLALPLLTFKSPTLAVPLICVAWTFANVYLAVVSAQLSHLSQEVTWELGAAVYAVGALLGMSLLPVEAVRAGLSMDGLQEAVFIAVAVIILTGILVPFERRGKTLWGLLATASESHTLYLERRCAEVAAAYGLTDREQEILLMLAQGRSRKEVSETLVVSPHTVRTHIQRIYEKIGVHSYQQLLNLLENRS